MRRRPEGVTLEYDLAKHSISIQAWGRPRFETQEAVNELEWCERIRAALGEAVERWTLSYVPIAC